MNDDHQKPLIVCNSGPLIALLGVGCLYVLHRLFQRIIVPDAVYQEITLSRELPGAKQIAGETWIETTSLSKPPDQLLRAELGAGEAEVISLAKELAADKVLIDERKGRRIAKNVYGLNIVGTGRILLCAKQKNMVQAVSPLLGGMKANGYYLSQRLISRIVQEAGE